MKCKSPSRIKVFPSVLNPDGWMEVPCGYCLQCRIRKVHEWAMRCDHERQYCKASCFLTLTYNDDNLPKNGTLVVRDLQLFFKRLRKNTKSRFKYYACGEYGDKKERCHYHTLLFGFGFQKGQVDEFGYVRSGPIYEAWPYGLIHGGSVTYDSARYVAGYIDKKYFGDRQKNEYTDRGLVVPFQLSSQGLGLSFALENREQLEKALCLTRGGVKFPLPQYYKKKLGIEVSDFQSVVMSKQAHTYGLHRKLGAKTVPEIRASISRSRLASEAKTKGRLRVRNRGGLGS